MILLQKKKKNRTVMMKRMLLPFCLSSLSYFSIVAAFAPSPSTRPCAIGRPEAGCGRWLLRNGQVERAHRSFWKRNTSLRNSNSPLPSNNNDGRPVNEFSRPYLTERMFPPTSASFRKPEGLTGSRDYREHTMEVTATIEECQALAKRFEIQALHDLSAKMTITKAPIDAQPLAYHSSSSSPSSSSSRHRFVSVQIEGTIQARVTQVCVRTNEQFMVQVEVPIQSIVRPVANDPDAFSLPNLSVEDDIQSSPTSRNKEKKKKNNNGKVKNNKDQWKSKNNLQALQQLLEQELSSSLPQTRSTSSSPSISNRNLDWLEDSILEDESIYSLTTGILDVGELVAQTFWLQLDPYPKKPGTGPRTFSISG